MGITDVVNGDWRWIYDQTTPNYKFWYPGLPLPASNAASKITIVVLCSIITVVNGMIIHVAITVRIYAKVIFVSLLFYFVDNIIDLKK